MFQSSLFVDFSGITDDWLDESGWFPAPNGWSPGRMLAVEEIILRFTGIFDFASRLALTNVFVKDKRIYIGVLVEGLQDRHLYYSDPVRRLPQRYESSMPRFVFFKEFSRDELIASPRALALQLSMELVQRFGWQPGKETLEDIQSRLGGPWRPFTGD